MPTLALKLSIPLLLIICLLAVPKVSAETVFSYPVLDLHSAEPQRLSTAGQLNVVLFFEPNCSWCFKQTKVFNQYLQQCGRQSHFVGLGVNANRQALKKTAWQLQADFPMYMASPELIDATGKIASTPLTLVLDAKGNIVAHVKGYINAEKWRQLLKQHASHAINCTA
jgi:thioredoxin-related protein